MSGLVFDILLWLSGAITGGGIVTYVWGEDERRRGK